MAKQTENPDATSDSTTGDAPGTHGGTPAHVSVFAGTDTVNPDGTPLANDDTAVRRFTSSQGKTRLRTRPGHAFRPSASVGVDYDITSDGVFVTAEQAAQIVTEADTIEYGYVVVVENDEA